MLKKLGRAGSCLGLALVLVLHGTAAAADAPSAKELAEKLFQYPSFGHAVLSPDGQKVAFRTAAKGQHSRLAVLDLPTMKPTIVAEFAEAGIGEIRWVNNRRLVFSLDHEFTPVGKIEFNPGLFAVDADGQRFRQLAETIGYFYKTPESENLLPQSTYLLADTASQSSDDTWVIIPEAWGKKTGVDYIRLKRLNTVNGRTEEVEAPLHAYRWVIDKDNELRAVLTEHQGRQALHFRDKGGAWRKLAEFDPFHRTLVPRAVDADGKLYVEASDDRDTVALYTWDFNAGQPSAKPVLASPEYDLHPGFVISQGKLLGYRLRVDAEVTHWVDPAMKALQETIDKLLPRTTNLITAARQAQSPFVLVHAYADTEPGQTLVFNVDTGKFTRLGTAMPELKGLPMGRMEMVRYPARDGMSIPAYLTLPAGSTKKSLPLVVLVHGGPFVRGMSWRWDAEVQFLASRGYAVLQPEFRGSTGFGSAHFGAGWKQWGQAMQDDLADGARWAIAQGIADPKRIAIAGASYGGYATLMGLIKDPDLFRCGFEWVGVTDQQLMYDVSWSDISDVGKEYDLPTLMGDPVKDAAMFKANSPLAQASRLKAPLLMAYGGKDQRVPIVHGEKLRDALKGVNPNVEWVQYADEGHGWVEPATNIDFWTRVDAFLARHMPATP